MRELYNDYTIKKVEFTSSTNQKMDRMFGGSLGYLYFKEGHPARFVEYGVGQGYMWTSTVQEVKFEGDLIVLITLNSIYTFTLYKEDV